MARMPSQSSSSIPAHTNGHASRRPDVERTKILLLGLRRSGKTSIEQVLFHDLQPKQTFYLERTTRVTKRPYDTVIPLEIWDCPGDIALEALKAEAPLSQFAALIFVIDIQDLYQPTITKMVETIVSIYQENPDISLEIFVHKSDVLSEEYKIENFRHLQERVMDELSYIGTEYEQLPVNFQLTSIYDHSLHDAFSRVIHKLIDSLSYLEDLLNVFCSNSQSSKAFLFDINSRLYVATDASPVDPPTHNLCNDYLQMLNAFGPLYKSITASPARYRIPSTSVANSLTSGASSPNSPSQSLRSHPSSPAATRPTLPSMNAAPTRSRTTSLPGSPTGSASPDGKPMFYPSASTSLAPSTAGAGAGTTLTYHLVTRQLALLALIPTAVFEARRGLVEYNVVFFREGVQEICQVEEEARRV
ncbi:hypothetical protein OBBRIDRAFT_697804, partial [Obba rivulosa]